MPTDLGCGLKSMTRLGSLGCGLKSMVSRGGRGGGWPRRGGRDPRHRAVELPETSEGTGVNMVDGDMGTLGVNIPR